MHVFFLKNSIGTMHGAIFYVALLSLPPRPLLTSSLASDLPSKSDILGMLTPSLDGRLFITFFPGSLVHHSRIKLHQDKHLNHFFEKYSKYCKPTLSEEKRLKSGGGFVITYLFSDDSC